MVASFSRLNPWKEIRQLDRRLENLRGLLNNAKADHAEQVKALEKRIAVLENGHSAAN